MNPHWAHPFSVIRDDKSKQNETEQNKTKTRVTQGERETDRGTRQNKNVYNYTTNLHIVHIFKDPRTVDQIEGAVQAQWYSMIFMYAQNMSILIQNLSKMGENTYQNNVKRN